MSSPVEILIREPGGLDLPKIWTLLQDVSNFLPNQTTGDDIFDKVVSQESFFPYVAILGQELVGFGSIFIFQRIRGGVVGYLEDIVVRSDLRHMGIGKLLVEKLLSKAWELDCHKVSLQASSGSETFYLNVGFIYGGKTFQIQNPRVRKS